MTITKQDVLKMDFAAISAAIKNPETSAAVQKLMVDREVATYVSSLMLKRKQEIDARETAANELSKTTIPPTTDELAAEANEMVAETPTETVVEVPVETPLSDTAAEDADYITNGVTPYRDSSGKIFKLVQEYQVHDDDGTPIGRPTHLEAKNLLELMGKQRKAHEEAVKFGYRMKQQKLKFKSDQPKPLLSPEVIQEAARQALAEQDGGKATDVVREVVRSEFEKEEIILRNRQAEMDGRDLALRFKAKHLHDFYDCDANKKALQDYFTLNSDLEFTLDALEVAFLDLQREGKLVPVPNRTSQTHVAPAANPATATSVENPTAVIPAPSAVSTETAPATNAAPPAASQPVATATVTTPAPAANATPPARRPAVNGGLPPGSLSAQRPVGQALPQTRKEFLQTITKMPAEEIKRRLKTDPQFVAGFKRHGIAIQ